MFVRHHNIDTTCIRYRVPGTCFRRTSFELGALGNVIALQIMQCGHTGWPRKNATPTINYFKKTRDRINKLCALLRIIFFPSKMTPRSLILMNAFGFYGRFSEAMSFSKFATSVSKVTIDVPKFSLVWLPRLKCLLLLWKTKTGWIKGSIHYVTLQCYNPGKALKEFSPYLNRDLWYKRGKFWKWHYFRRMALEWKRLNDNHWSWCHFAGKLIFYAFMYSLIWFIDLLIYLQLVIVGVAFFLGHPYVLRIPQSGWPLGRHRRFCSHFPPSLSVLSLSYCLFQPHTRPFTYVVLPSFLLSSSCSFPWYSALQYSFGESWWSCDVTVKFQFSFLHCCQEVFIRPDYSMDAVDHLFIGDAVFVRDAKESAKASHLGCLYPPFKIFC